MGGAQTGQEGLGRQQIAHGLHHDSLCSTTNRCLDDELDADCARGGPPVPLSAARCH
jgi:hypothetical protein